MYGMLIFFRMLLLLYQLSYFLTTLFSSSLLIYLILNVNFIYFEIKIGFDKPISIRILYFNLLFLKFSLKFAENIFLGIAD